MTDYNIEYIDRLRIHELRDFARKVGVSSPTTLKKEELIDRITEAIRNPGPEENVNKFNKHHKDFDFFTMLLSDDSTLLDDIIAQEDEELRNKEDSRREKNSTFVIKSANNSSKNDVDYSDFLRTEMSAFNFKVSQNPAEYRHDIKYSTTGGYLQILPEGYGVIRGEELIPSADDIYISASLIKKYRLKNGVYIHGKVRHLIEDKPQIMYEIISLESDFSHKNTPFEDMPYNPIGEEFYFDKHNIKVSRGERVYIQSSDLQSAINLCSDLLEENGVRAKFINVKCRPEEQVKSNQKLQTINCFFSMSPEKVLQAVDLTIERLKRELEYNNASVLVIYNFSELVRLFNVAIQGYYDFSKISLEAIERVNNILSLAKSIEYNLSSTIICIDKNGIPADIKNIMELEIMPIFNNIIDTIK